MKRLLDNPLALSGLGIVGFFVALALCGTWLVGDPTEFVGAPLEPPSVAHWFGTTGQGQDVFAQTIAGASSTLLVGFLVGLLEVLIGALLGTAAGYYGGWIDELLSLLINVFLILPGLPLIVVLAAYLPAGPGTMILVLVLTGWAWGARVFRSQTLSLRRRDFVLAAKASGEGDLHIILCEILPNMSPLLAAAFIGSTLYAVGAQVGLEFLGLGDVSRVTWGTNLYWASNDAALLTGSWWTFVPTGLCVAILGFGLAMLNSAIDEIGNPRLASHKAYEEAQREAQLKPGLSTPVILGEMP